MWNLFSVEVSKTDLGSCSGNSHGFAKKWIISLRLNHKCHKQKPVLDSERWAWALTCLRCKAFLMKGVLFETVPINNVVTGSYNKYQGCTKLNLLVA